ncbi:hypothetical protein HKX48_003594 [Thoreauomyces humboldtii]|nr:hypothetical protein HKX48_003594 [Thoreauomyces humboldtii]
MPEKRPPIEIYRPPHRGEGEHKDPHAEERPRITHAWEQSSAPVSSSNRDRAPSAGAQVRPPPRIVHAWETVVVDDHDVGSRRSRSRDAKSKRGAGGGGGGGGGGGNGRSTGRGGGSSPEGAGQGRHPHVPTSSSPPRGGAAGLHIAGAGSRRGRGGVHGGRAPSHDSAADRPRSGNRDRNRDRSAGDRHHRRNDAHPPSSPPKAASSVFSRLGPKASEGPAAPPVRGHVTTAPFVGQTQNRPPLPPPSQIKHLEPPNASATHARSTSAPPVVSTSPGKNQIVTGNWADEDDDFDYNALPVY